MARFEEKTWTAEGGIRHRLSMTVCGRPPSGSWSEVMFTDVRDCMLKCVGVPVKFPVLSRTHVKEKQSIWTAKVVNLLVQGGIYIGP